MSVLDDLHLELGGPIGEVVDEFGWNATVEALRVPAGPRLADNVTLDDYGVRENGDPAKIIVAFDSAANLQREWGRDAGVTAQGTSKDDVEIEFGDRITFREGPYIDYVFQVVTNAKRIYAGGVRSFGMDVLRKPDR